MAAFSIYISNTATAFALVLGTSSCATPASDVFDSDVRNQAQVYVIGEVHDDITVMNKKVGLMRRLKSEQPSTDCLFTEFDHSESAKFDEFNDGSSFDNTLDVAQTNFAILHRGARELVPRRLAESARELRLRLVPVDIEWSSQSGRTAWNFSESVPGSHRLYLEGRSKEMAENIFESIRDHRCTKGILVVGINHVTKTVIEGQPIQTVQSQLKKLGINTQTFDISGAVE